MPISTNYVRYFEIVPYHEGFLLRYPSKTNPSVLAPVSTNQKLFTTLEEYKDIHRVLDINTVYKLNRQITQGNSAELVLLAEYSKQKRGKSSTNCRSIFFRKNYLC